MIIIDLQELGTFNFKNIEDFTKVVTTSKYSQLNDFEKTIFNSLSPIDKLLFKEKNKDLIETSSNLFKSISKFEIFCAHCLDNKYGYVVDIYEYYGEYCDLYKEYSDKISNLFIKNKKEVINYFFEEKEKKKLIISF